MKLKIYQVDAFADKVFSGNPAAICPLEQWLSDDIMLKIAAENNLAETAFYVKKDDQFEIRWFTPTVEVDLCGHATLATAFVLFNHENYTANTIQFYSPRSGKLEVTKNHDLLTLNFPSDVFEETSITDELLNCFDIRPKLAFRGKSDYMLIFNKEEEISNIVPDFDKISKLESRGVIITAKGNKTDFVSRFFGPQVGIIEDPVTGSAHTTLIPYWANELGKTLLSAIQLSERKGYLLGEFLGERVEISGEGKLYLMGKIYFD